MKWIIAAFILLMLALALTEPDLDRLAESLAKGPCRPDPLTTTC